MISLLLFWFRASFANDSDEKGQTVGEYVLVLAVLAVAVLLAAVVAYRSEIIDLFDS